MRTMLVVIALASLLPAPITAQGPLPAARRNGIVAESHGIVRDEQGDAWALGRDYKARIADGVIEFTPALGLRAARNRTLSFQLQSVACDATPLPIVMAASEPRVDGMRVEFNRGVCTERYECRPDGVEQSFVFAMRPAGNGDLVVRGAITTTLQPTQREDGTWFFHDGEVGGVTIGSVTGIDARGASCPGEVAFADGVLTLRLPAAFVASAVFPLVLDPLIGTGFLAGSTFLDEDQVDVAYESTLDLWCLVWRRSYSSADQDIQAQRITGLGSPWGTIVAITLTPDAEGMPSVAAVNARNRFVIAWNWSLTMFGPWQVRAATLATTASPSPTVNVSTGACSAYPPAVCGDRSTTGTSALVAWVQGNEPTRRVLQVASAGTITLGTVYATTTLPASSLKLPRSRVPGGIAVMLSTPWLSFPRAEVLDYNGASIAAPVIVAYHSEDGFDGDGTNFLIVQRSPNALILQPFAWNGSALVFGASTSHATPTLPTAIAAAWLGERFLVAWEQTTANPFDSEVRALTVKPDCTTCSVEFLLPVVVNPNQRTPAIGACFHGGGTNAALLAWCEAELAPPLDSLVVAQRFEAMTGATAQILSAPGPGGGISDTEEPFAIGSENFAFRLSGADPSAPIAVLGLSDGNTTPIPCGTTFINALASFAMPTVAGGARHPLPVPCSPLLLGFTLEYQWILLGSVHSPCPIAPGITAGERRLLTLTM